MGRALRHTPIVPKVGDFARKSASGLRRNALRPTVTIARRQFLGPHGRFALVGLSVPLNVAAKGLIIELNSVRHVGSLSSRIVASKSTAPLLTVRRSRSAKPVRGITRRILPSLKLVLSTIPTPTNNRSAKEDETGTTSLWERQRLVLIASPYFSPGSQTKSFVLRPARWLFGPNGARQHGGTEVSGTSRLVSKEC